MKMAPGPWVKVTFSAVAALAAIILPRPHAASAAAEATPGPDNAYRPHPVAPAVATMVRASRLYTVISGDSISAVAVKECHGQAKDWTGIYAESRAEHLTGRNANQISIGQHLAINCVYLPGQLKYALAVAPPPVPQAAVTTSSASPVSYGGYQQCVISRESGGQTQVMNGSGHYGLYQFDYGTWVSGGGASADFGHASVAEQNRVFAAVYAVRGTQPWSPSDGC